MNLTLMHMLDVDQPTKTWCHDAVAVYFLY